MIKLSPDHLGSLVGASWRSKKACKHVYYKQETEGKSFFNKPVLRISNYFSRFLIKCFTGIDGRLFLFVLLSPTGLCLLRQAPDPPPPQSYHSWSDQMSHAAHCSPSGARAFSFCKTHVLCFVNERNSVIIFQILFY